MSRVRPLLPTEARELLGLDQWDSDRREVAFLASLEDDRVTPGKAFRDQLTAPSARFASNLRQGAFAVGIEVRHVG